MVPIKSITRKSTSDKFVYQNGSTEPGPCAQLLGALLDDIYKGKTEDKFGWLAKVKEPDVKANGTGQVNGKAH
jgi:branched-chain amino acid aminotransferase